METMEEETMLEKERPKRSGRLFIAYTVLFTVMMLLVFEDFYTMENPSSESRRLSQVGASMHYNGYFYRSCLQTGSMEIFLFDVGLIRRHGHGCAACSDL